MKQALILCGGKAERLRPYSLALPKSCTPFLNLPLLSLGWFYMEQMGVSSFLLNSHLFPETLNKNLKWISRSDQKWDVFFEEECLGGAGILYKLRKLLQKEPAFFYLNGDSLFFPSHKKQLLAFEEEFLKRDLDALFFSAPLKDSSDSAGALYCDKSENLKFVGRKENIPSSLKKENLSPFRFSGLALFKRELLNHLKEGDFELFFDFIYPLLGKKKVKVFSDPSAVVLEAGEKLAVLSAVKFCLQLLYEKKFKNSPQREILKEYFHRFDAKDQIVGWENGKKWSEKLGHPLLAPKSVKGLNHLELKGMAVLGPDLELKGKSVLKDVVLGSQLLWKGNLERDIVLNFFPKAK